MMDDCLKSDILAAINSCEGRLWHINHDYMWIPANVKTID